MTQPAAKPLARFSFTLPGFHAQLEAPPPGSPPEPRTQPGSLVQTLLLVLQHLSQLYQDNCVQFTVSVLLPLLERKLPEDGAVLPESPCLEWWPGQQSAGFVKGLEAA